MMPKIQKRGSDILKTVCEPVTDFNLARSIVAEMLEALQRGSGVGLAANQIGHNARIIVIANGPNKVAIVNPVIVKSYGGKESGREGCLSEPGTYYQIIRDKQVRVHGFDINGEPVNYKFNGLNARIVQHENDHLNGIGVWERYEIQDDQKRKALEERRRRP